MTREREEGEDGEREGGREGLQLDTSKRPGIPDHTYLYIFYIVYAAKELSFGFEIIDA